MMKPKHKAHNLSSLDLKWDENQAPEASPSPSKKRRDPNFTFDSTKNEEPKRVKVVIAHLYESEDNPMRA